MDTVMNSKSIALALCCSISLASVAAAERVQTNTSNQVSRQSVDYSGLDQPEFEKQFSAKFAGTYAIYNGLPDSKKSEIYQAAAAGTEVTKLRSMILIGARSR